MRHKQWLGVLFCLWVSASALAQEPTNKEKAKALFKESETYFRVGEYEKALDGYKQAYLLSKASGLLYNIAQCNRFLGKKEEALRGYQLYLQDVPNTKYLAEVEAIIKDLEDQIALEKATKAVIVQPETQPTTQQVLPQSIPASLQVIPATIATSAPAAQPGPSEAKPWLRPFVVPGALFLGGGALGAGTLLLERQLKSDDEFTRGEQAALIVTASLTDLFFVSTAVTLGAVLKKRLREGAL
jgi:tetratricopeptide (TPR) repeat protein